VSRVNNSTCGLLYFFSYIPWKIGLVASPETSKKQVFLVKYHNFFIIDPNLVRQNSLVRVHSLVCCVAISYRFNKYSICGTLYKVSL
jgi:hypothetical protein